MKLKISISKCIQVVFLTFALLLSASAPGQRPGAKNQEALEILKQSAVQGGLVVHLGCGDGKLTAALRVNERYLVQGLDANPKNIEEARKHIQSLGLYGPVTADLHTGSTLPFADDLVNLLVADGPIDVPTAEIMRVLSPLGVAYLKSASGKWKSLVKPRPDDIDDWSHFLHDASNNAVAQDERVATPRRLKWVDGPLWTRSHEFISSICAMVSSGGRIFYILDEGLTGVTDKPIPEKWTLIARDAFNGLLLWKRPVDKWGTEGWKNAALRSIPLTVPRRIVAEGDRVFMTLGYDAPVSVLDAATGETLSVLDQTDGVEEIRYLDGVLLLRKGANLLLAMDAKSGKKLWEASGKIRSLTLAASGGKVFYQADQAIVCRDLRKGDELWSVEEKAALAMLLIRDERIVLSSRGQLRAISAKTGQEIWAVKGGVSRQELFIAQNQLWHWDHDTIVGRDMATGEIKTRPDTTDVFTPGHHLRCYQSKATDNYLVTSNRGAEFVSLTGGEHAENDWTRGACRYGVMPCNGLLYVPPNPCFCYTGVKLTGLNAFAPAGKSPVKDGKNPLEKGPAYKAPTPDPQPLTPNPNDWPTYRHDPFRSGATAAEAPAKVQKKWRTAIGGKLTPPIAAGGLVFVAGKDTQTLYALAADDGREQWRHIAGGRIDSPPTVYKGLLLFGSADGTVTCLRATDGALVWRFRAAPSDQKIVAFGRLESPWRVHGNVLVMDDVAYFTAGRSTYLDGGIRVFGLNPMTGEILHKTRLDTWAPTREDTKGKPFVAGYHMEGAFSDLLVTDGEDLYLGQMKLDSGLIQQEVPYVMADPDKKVVRIDPTDKPYTVPNRTSQNYETHQRDWIENTQPEYLKELNEKYGGYNLGDRQFGRHVFATGGFLDDSWFNRTYWMNSETWPGFYLANRAPKTGHLLVAGPEKTYAVRAYPSRNLQSPLFTPGDKGYLLFADANENEAVLDDRTRGTTKGWGFGRLAEPVWYKWTPIRIRAMVLTGKTLFVAGPPDVVDPADPMAAFEGRKGGVLRAVSASDGKTLHEIELDSPPEFDAMIAADKCLYLSLRDGSVLSLGANK